MLKQAIIVVCLAVSSSFASAFSFDSVKQFATSNQQAIKDAASAIQSGNYSQLSKIASTLNTTELLKDVNITKLLKDSNSTLAHSISDAASKIDLSQLDAKNTTAVQQEIQKQLANVTTPENIKKVQGALTQEIQKQA